MLLSEAIVEFDLAMQGVKSEATRRWYGPRLRSLLESLGDVEVEQVRTGDLRRWRAGLLARTERWANHPTRPTRDGKLSKETVRGYVRAARRLFRWLVDEGVLEHSPARRLELPPKSKRAPKAVHPEDVVAMLEVADVREEAVIRFLADTGCRVGGLAGLRLDALDVARERAVVVEKGRGGGKVRVVYFGEETAAALGRYLEVRGRQVVEGEEDEVARVFWGQRGPLTENGIYQLLKRVAARAGVEGRWNPHAFRHGWAHGALLAGADMGTVSDVLGHSSIQVTHEFYSRWEDKELAERSRRFSWINNHHEEDEDGDEAANSQGD